MGARLVALGGLVLGCACGTDVVTAPPGAGGTGGSGGDEGSTGGYEFVLPSDHHCRDITGSIECCDDPKCRFVKVFRAPNDFELMCMPWAEDCSDYAQQQGKGGGIEECPAPYTCWTTEDACGVLGGVSHIGVCQLEIPTAP